MLIQPIKRPGTGRRLVGIGILLAMVVLFGGSAFACAPLATLDLDRAVARPGDVIHAHGKGFVTAAGAGAVDLRWNSADGEVLASAGADDQGRVSLAFTVPQAAAGYVVIFASLHGGGGAPARSVLQLPGDPAQGPVKAVAEPDPSDHHWAGGLVLVALGLFGIGLTLGGVAIAVAHRTGEQKPQTVVS
jgi:hypothetical protein